MTSTVEARPESESNKILLSGSLCMEEAILLSVVDLYERLISQ